MWFLYAELLALMLVSFVVGSAAAALVVRLVVKAPAVQDQAPMVDPRTPGGAS